MELGLSKFPLYGSCQAIRNVPRASPRIEVEFRFTLRVGIQV